MIIQYQDPKLTDVFEGDKLYVLSDSSIHEIKEVKLGLEKVSFINGFDYWATGKVLRGCILIRKVDIDI